MPEALVCYRCGAGLESLPLPLGRLDECPACRVQLHCCRMCRFFDPQVARQCREDDAADVSDKHRANFCDYFKPNPQAHDPRFARADRQARDQLSALFGDGHGDAPESPPPAGGPDPDDLFR